MTTFTKIILSVAYLITLTTVCVGTGYLLGHTEGYNLGKTIGKFNCEFHVPKELE